MIAPRFLVGWSAVAASSVAVARAFAPPSSPYLLDLKLNPYRASAGQAVQMTVSLKEREGAKPVTEFEAPPPGAGAPAAPKDAIPIQLLMVRGDLGALYEGTPTRATDGSVNYAFAFPSGGDWRVFAEFTPKGQAAPQVAVAKIAVDGAREFSTPLEPSGTVRTQQNGLNLEGRPGKVVAGQPVTLELNLKANRQAVPAAELLPASDGAPAKLFFIEKDAETFVRARYDASPREGALVFAAVFPKPGVYRAWLQVRRRESTVPTLLAFVIRVSDK